VSNRSKQNKPRTQPGKLAAQQQQTSSAGAEAGQIAVTRTEARFFSGPLPPPEVFEEFDRVVPGSARRIFDLVEKQTNHRIELESKVIASDITRSRAGLWMGLVVSLAAIVGGVYVAVTVSPTAGATIATASVVGLAGVFVYGTYSRRQERQQKAEQIKSLTKSQ
jgi:uncharacterized membrane protein